MVNKRVRNAVLGCSLKNDRMISVHCQGKPFNITVIQAYAPTSNAEEAEVEWFYEDLQDLLELTPKNDVLFIIMDWNSKVASQETSGVTGKFGVGVWNEAGQNSISFCPASFPIPRPNLPVTPVSWLLLCIPVLYNEKDIFLGLLVLKGLVGLNRTVQLQFLQRYSLGHRLGLPWYWMVCLGNEQRSFCHFWDCIQVLHFGLFCWPWWPLHFF